MYAWDRHRLEYSCRFLLRVPIQKLSDAVAAIGAENLGSYSDPITFACKVYTTLTTAPQAYPQADDALRLVFPEAYDQIEGEKTYEVVMSACGKL